MPAYSVKKPLTIFCCAIAIIVLGVVAYLRMTPDLFPSMDFPYVLIITTAPGQSSESVEADITKPMEQSMATLDHIKNVTSSSSDNYSMVTLEFEDDVNLDTIGVDIQQNISTLQADWAETVGTPYVLKINPSMIPVNITAVSMKDMDVKELSAFVEDTLMPQLEGINGVARISASGAVEQEIHVVISQEKIDALNEKIIKAINAKLDKAEAQLHAAQKQMSNALSQAMDNSGSTQTPPADSSASSTGEAQEMIQQQIAQLEESKKSLQSAIDALSTLQDALHSGTTSEDLSPADRQKKQELEEKLANINAQLEPYQKEIKRIQDSDLPAEEKQAQLRAITDDETYRQLVSDQATTRMELTAFQLDPSNQNSEDLEKLLADAGLDVSQVDTALTEMINSLNALQSSIDALQELSRQLQEQAIQLDEANRKYQEIMQKLDNQNLSAESMVSGLSKMVSAMVQIENGLSSLESGRETALSQADLNGILSLKTVAQILAAQNFSMPAGYVEQDGIQYMVSVGDEFQTEEQLGDLLLVDMGLEGVDPIYLKDVADVFISDNADSLYAKLNGGNGVMLSFEKQSNYATASVSEAIDAKLNALQKAYPGLEFFSLMDQGDYIRMIVNSILESLLSGALFAILVLFLFLKDLRPTFITLVSMPLSVVFAIVLMYFSGITLNMISLSGLSIAVGMLVDNSVVVIENIYRLRAKGANAVQAAVSGAKQVAGAITASTLTTICVFLPIVFVDGLTKQLFTDLSLTMTYALLASLIVALTLVPAMSAGLLKKDSKPKKDIMSNVYSKYRAAGNWALDHKPIVFLSAIAMLALTAGLCLARGFIFIPNIDSNTVTATISFDDDTDQETAKSVADKVLAYAGDIEGVENVGAMMGSSSMMSMSAANDTTVTVYITLPEGMSGTEVGNQLLKDCSDLPCDLSVTASMMDMSMLTGSGVSMHVYSDDMESLQSAAKALGAALEKVPGTAEVSNGLEDSAEALHINIDRNKAMEKGFTIAQIYMQLATDLTDSATATSFKLDGSSIDVVVDMPEESKVTVDSLLDETFTQTAADGTTSEFKLSDVATVEKTVSMTTIHRDNQKRYLTVSAELEDGYNVTKVTQAAEKALKNVELPENVTYEFTGENETIMEAMQQLVLMLLLGMLLVYFVMVAQFQSLKSPFIVMFTIPLAFTGGFLALLLTGMEFSIISMIGFVMLMGIIVNNGIVLVDYINQLRLEGWDRREAILEAGVTRIRPILMTSLTTILGLFVMALGKDVGTALMQPMAVVCIGGLIYATLMTLFVVPCIYDLMNKKELRHVDEADLVILED